MKYSAKFIRTLGVWAVCEGKYYLKSTVHISEKVVRERALVRNLKHYHDIAKDCFGKLCEMNGGSKHDNEVTLSDPDEVAAGYVDRDFNSFFG